MIHRGPFLIKPEPANRDGSIPAHWDILIEGSDDSIATVWDSQAMAEHFCDFMVQWSQNRHAERLAEIRA